MGSARAVIACRAAPAAAEALWYDTSRWPAFVDGCAHVVSVDGPWPDVGSEVRWTSTPAGRGNVVERVTAYRPGGGQARGVEDARLSGTQRVAFERVEGGGTEITLDLDYRLTGLGPVAALVDLLFVRRAVGDSLRRTLERFAVELA